MLQFSPPLNIVFLLNIWDFNTRHPDQTCFPFLQGSPSHTCALPPIEKKYPHQVQFVFPIYSLEHGQALCDGPLKITESSLHSHTHQKPTVKSYTSPVLSRLLRTLLNGFLSGLLLSFFNFFRRTRVLTEAFNVGSH